MVYNKLVASLFFLKAKDIYGSPRLYFEIEICVDIAIYFVIFWGGVGVHLSNGDFLYFHDLSNERVRAYLALKLLASGIC